MEQVKSNKNILKRIFIIIFVLIELFCISTAAQGPYRSYNYNAYDESVPSPTGYLPSGKITGDKIGISSFNNPTDLFYDGKEYAYLLDSGNSKVVVLNKQLELVKEVFPQKNKEEINFVDAKGVFVDADKNIYIADTAGARVLILDSKGELLTEITKPESELLPEGFDFKPTNVVVNSDGIVLVISQGCYNGALQFSKKYEFQGFFGSETVTVTPELLIKEFWNKILPKSMRDKQFRSVPVNYNNFTIDSEGFVYTCKNDVDSNEGQIRKLNYFGDNILWYKNVNETRTYGDIETYYDPKYGNMQSIISDVCVDSNGIISALDTNRKRIFQFDSLSNLLFVFGGSGNQLGRFDTPTAIECIDDKILIVDSVNGDITIFNPTHYGELMRKGANLYRDGEYTQATQCWNEVMQYDQFNLMANLGYGKSLVQQGEYKKAMEHFEIARDKDNYGYAFYHYRAQKMEKVFPFILLGVVVLVVGFIIIAGVRRKRVVSDYHVSISPLKYPIHTMFHPFKGYTGLKQEKKGSILLANIILVLFFIVSIISEQVTGFLFKESRPEDFNIVVTFVSTIGVFIVWVVTNWGISTLMDGEGRFAEIWVFNAYALLPLVILSLPLALFSRTLSIDESYFYQIVNTIILLWVGIGFLMAIKEVHQFTMGQTILAMLGSVLGILIVVGLYAIIYSMLIQFISFLGTVFNEIILRL